MKPEAHLSIQNMAIVEIGLFFTCIALAVIVSMAFVSINRLREEIRSQREDFTTLLGGLFVSRDHKGKHEIATLVNSYFRGTQETKRYIVDRISAQVDGVRNETKSD